ncbi:MAG: tetratricopeptide repeat protein [bacterium]|nr:tetratricopeptide repeat protein [bacterium]
MSRPRRKSKRKIASSTEQSDSRPAEVAGAVAKPWSATGLLLVVMMAVAAVVMVVHRPALYAEVLSFDDTQYLTDNPLVQNPSWAAAGRFLGEVFEPSTVGGYYQPLSMISLMLDHALGGRADNLFPFHRTSLLLHTANTVLVILLLYLLFRRVWVAGLIGLLFGVHPLTVETIAWIGERKTLLASFFVLWCLIAYVRHARRRSPMGYGVAVLMFVMALMSKPTTTPLPVLLLLLDCWPLRRLNRRAVLEKIPFLLIACVSAVVTVVSQARTASATMPGDYPAARVPLILCHNIIFYLYKIVWPTDLSSHYPVPEPLSLAAPMVLAGVVGTCLLVAVLLLSWRRTPALLVGSVFFFVAIFPTMGVIGFTNVIAADKFAYFPSLGLMLILAWALSRWWDRPPVVAQRVVMVLVVLGVCGAEVRGTRHYLSYWGDTETFYARMIELEPGAASLHWGLGYYLYAEGRYDDAVSEYLEALRLDPDSPDVPESLGVVLARQGRLDEAIAHYRRMLEAQPGSARIHNNLGLALFMREDVDEAVTQFQRALELDPEFARAHKNLGVVYSHRGQHEEAIAALQRALSADPSFAGAHNNLGLELMRLGRVAEALEHCEAAVRLNPGLAVNHRNLGSALARLDRLEEAESAYRGALAIRPHDADLHYLLGRLLNRQGRRQDALTSYQEAFRLDPGHSGARRLLEADSGDSG